MGSKATVEELAINGAPPAFRELLHVGRPNIGDTNKFLAYATDILNRRWLSNNGPVVQEFENRVADYLGVKHCIAMCNGTVALEIAIRALGLTGEVIIPSYTFIATAHALSWQEITPVFADIDPQTHALCPDSVRKMITPQTTGIVGVHLWGKAAPINELQEIADEFNLHLMFDAAHAFGVSYQGKMIGNFGSCEVMSFHATKFFNTFEGGAILTNDDELAHKMKLMRNFGFAGFDSVIHLGTNGKMIEMAAAMGLVNLDSIEMVITANQKNYFTYKENLSSLNCVQLFALDENEKNNYQYVVLELLDNCPVSRDQLIEVLHAENILARKYFWPGCHNMQPYKSLFPDAGMWLENTRLVADRVVVLPTGTTISKDEITLICEVINTALKVA